MAIERRTLFKEIRFDAFVGKGDMGGEGGIRTLGSLAATHDLQSCALDHYATSPILRIIPNFPEFLILTCRKLSAGPAVPFPLKVSSWPLPKVAKQSLRSHDRTLRANP